LGYISRALGARDVTYVNYFLIQIACTVISPAFFSAGLYLTIGNMYGPVATLLNKSAIIAGKANSSLKPIYYILIFSSIDLIALIIQSIGGAQAAVAMKSGTAATAASHITVYLLLFKVNRHWSGIRYILSGIWQYRILIHRYCVMVSYSSKFYCHRHPESFPQNK
jgi:RTA1 like protein